MRKILALLLLIVFLSGCYTVTQVGNCKYYSRKQLSSKGRAHQLVSF